MIPRKAVLAVVTILAAATVLEAQRRSPADMDAMLAKIATFEEGQDREPLGQFREMVYDSMGSPAQLRQIEARLLQFLKSKPTTAGRDFAFDQLTYIATEASVPFLSTMLEPADTAEQARFLLERIPGAAASEALRKRLAAATGNTKIGIINSLGRKHDTASVSAIAALISPSDKGVTEASLAALANIADPAAVKALASARTKLDGLLREEASEAYAACAEQVAKRGDKTNAIRMFREILSPQESADVRVRALAGLAELDGKNSIPLLVASAHSKDRREQAAAMAFLTRIPEATKVMIDEFPKLNAASQVRVLSVLADRRDATAKPLALAALKNNSGAVRAAGFAALGQLGDESSVTLLAEAAAQSPGPEQEAARQSLWSLPGAKVDSAITEGIASKSGKVRIELITAAGERGITSATGDLSKAVRDTDPDVQRAALKALRNIGGPEQVSIALDALLKAPTAGDRREAAQTLSALLKKSPPTSIKSVLSAYESNPSVESRTSLLEVLGQSSNAEALPVLRRSLTDSNPDVVRAAILALGSWSNTEPLPDLYTVAKEGKEPAHRVLALRGYIKLLSLPSQRPVSESARMLSDAMQLAKEPAEKRSLLSLLPSYPSQESLQLAEGLLRDDAVANEAKIAVARVKGAMEQR